LSSIPLIGYILLGSNIRYIADDYCYTNIANNHGAFEMVIGVYNLWSGRFTMTLLAWILAPLGTAITPLLPLVWVLLWLSTLAYLLTQVAVTIGLQKPTFIGLLLAPLLLVTTLVRLPNLVQSFYWQVGAITYALPLILSTGYAGWLIQALRRRESLSMHSIALAGMIPFILGGFSETHATTQFTPLIVALGLALIWQWRNRSLHIKQIAMLAIAVVGAGLAITLVAAAPGNQLRNTTVGNSIGRNITLDPFFESIDIMLWPLYKPIQQIIATIPAAADFLDVPMLDVESVKNIGLTAQAITTLALFGTSALAAASLSTRNINPRQSLMLLVGLLVATGLFICSAIFPGYYALGVRPPDRIYIGAHFLASGMILASGFILGSSISQTQIVSRVRLLVPVGFVSVLGMFASMGLVIAQTPPIQEYAQRWTVVNEQLLAAQGEPLVTFDRPAQLGELVLFRGDPTYWANICVAEFYKVGAIEAR
jgi:hypothetical protein